MLLLFCSCGKILITDVNIQVILYFCVSWGFQLLSSLSVSKSSHNKNSFLSASSCAGLPTWSRGTSVQVLRFVHHLGSICSFAQKLCSHSLAHICVLWCCCIIQSEKKEVILARALVNSRGEFFVWICFCLRSRCQHFTFCEHSLSIFVHEIGAFICRICRAVSSTSYIVAAAFVSTEMFSHSEHVL